MNHKRRCTAAGKTGVVIERGWKSVSDQQAPDRISCGAGKRRDSTHHAKGDRGARVRAFVKDNRPYDGARRNVKGMHTIGSSVQNATPGSQSVFKPKRTRVKLLKKCVVYAGELKKLCCGSGVESMPVLLSSDTTQLRTRMAKNPSW
jgi:hypothetical protein